MDTFKHVDKNVIDQNFYLIDRYVNKLQGGESWVEPTADLYGHDYSFYNDVDGDIPCVCLKTPDGSGYNWKAYAGGVYQGPFAPLIMPVGPFEAAKDSAKPVDNADVADANFALIEKQYQRRNASNLCPYPSADLRYWKWQHQTDTGDNFVICCKAADGSYYWKGPVTPSDVTYTLTTHVNDASLGSVTPGGTYKSGSIEKAVALPVSGASFTGWTGDASGKMNPLVVLMDRNKDITANFTGGGGQLPENFARFHLPYLNDSAWDFNTYKDSTFDPALTSGGKASIVIDYRLNYPAYPVSINYDFIIWDNHNGEHEIYSTSPITITDNSWHTLTIPLSDSDRSANFSVFSASLVVWYETHATGYITLDMRRLRFIGLGGSKTTLDPFIDGWTWDGDDPVEYLQGF